jgi:hypothetical protein
MYSNVCIVWFLAQFIYLYAKMKVSGASEVPLTIRALVIGYKLQLGLDG